MVIYDDFREILGLMALILGFSLALLMLPSAIQKQVSVKVPHAFPSAQPSTQVEKITVPEHTLFAN
ncbi:MAG: hypothetical protein ABIP54_02835 [Candidatus Andersenbacteria bacterium]